MALFSMFISRVLTGLLFPCQKFCVTPPLASSVNVGSLASLQNNASFTSFGYVSKSPSHLTTAFRNGYYIPVNDTQDYTDTISFWVTDATNGMPDLSAIGGPVSPPFQQVRYDPPVLLSGIVNLYLRFLIKFCYSPSQSMIVSRSKCIFMPLHRRPSPRRPPLRPQALPQRR